MSAHTPGPWVAGDLYADDCGQPEIAIHANVNGVTCYPAAVCLQFPRAAGMQLANAYLIAAAPDLLAALKRLYADYCMAMTCEFDYPGNPWSPERDGGDPGALAASAAISKAEGGAA